mgnify:CR=1 FL=1
MRELENALDTNIDVIESLNRTLKQMDLDNRDAAAKAQWEHEAALQRSREALERQTAELAKLKATLQTEEEEHEPPPPGAGDQAKRPQQHVVFLLATFS